MAIDATVVVQFGDGASDDGFVVVSLDDTRNLDASGDSKTSFYPGDEVYFFVHMDPGLHITKVTKTAGTITNLGIQTFHDHTTSVQFVDIDETAELERIPTVITHTIWWGNQPTYTRDVRLLTNTFDGPAIGEISCSFIANLFLFTPPSMELAEDEEFPVLIVIHVE